MGGIRELQPPPPPAAGSAPPAAAPAGLKQRKQSQSHIVVMGSDMAQAAVATDLGAAKEHRHKHLKRLVRAAGLIKGWSSAAQRRAQQRREILEKPAEQRTSSDIAVLEEFVMRVRFLEGLSSEARLDICRYAVFERHQPGAVLFRQGDSGESFYIIVSGEVEIALEPDGWDGSTIEAQTAQDSKQESTRGKMRQPQLAAKRVVSLEAGQSFGELALQASHSRRAGTCTVRGPHGCELLVVGRATFDRVLKHHMTQEVTTRMKFLRSLPCFQDLLPMTLHNLAQVMTTRTYPSGTVLLRQGDDSDDMFFLHQGECRVLRRVKFVGMPAQQVGDLHLETGPTGLLFYSASVTPRVVPLASPRLLQLASPRTAPALATVNTTVHTSSSTEVSSTHMPSLPQTPIINRPFSSPGKPLVPTELPRLDLPPCQPCAQMHAQQTARVVLEVGNLIAPAVLGEMGVVQRKARSASVIATTQVEVFVLTKWDFMSKITTEGLAAMQTLSNSYSSDEELFKEFSHNVAWARMRHQLVGDILRRLPKHRHQDKRISPHAFREVGLAMLR